ncbi:MAG: hypothetical protein PHP45_09275 [Elusimicrobiales bacterium]|nr:hypothetical protein [Elusimicrobiales bacterium]
MKNAELLKKAEALGFPLLQAETGTDDYRTLAEVIRSRNPRLWEGFPVMLANAAEKGDFSFAQLKARMRTPTEKNLAEELLLVSVSLYNAARLKFAWAQTLPEQQKYSDNFKNNAAIKIGDYSFPPEKLKAVFNAYRVKSAGQITDILSARSGFGVEYAMSQIFTAKQKELFFKKLRGEKLTKTEKEYFSRTVKKKVAALANEDLHRLAVKLLE